jgi:YD repeat-containing protein
MDDLRIHPSSSAFKSYVYDPNTLKLIAELDNLNFATYYHYDEEGKLIRVLKATKEGIFTIKESRDNIAH